MIRVLIAHQYPLVRVGLRSILGCQGIQVVGEVQEQASLLELALHVQPDIILFDGMLASGQTTTVEVVAALRRAGMAILVFAPSYREEDLFRFLMSGAAAYVSPTITSENLVEKIRRVADGEYLFSSAMLVAPVRPHQMTPGKQELRPDLHRAAQLTQREIAILKLVVKGLANKQIGLALDVNDQTVKNYITSIFKKLQVHDRTAAVVVALRRKLISLSETE